MDLFSIADDHDLPPKWDGRPITWAGWQSPLPTTMDFHAPLEALACNECGTIDSPEVNRGRVAAWPGETTIVDVVARTRSGREYIRKTEQQAQQKTTLVALRCPHCENDTVLDMTTNELWDLTSADYTDTGSREGQ